MRIAIFSALAMSLLAGCARRPPTPEGTTLVEWMGGPSGPSPRVTKHLRLRSQEHDEVADVDCTVGATAKELTYVRCVVVKNLLGTHVEAEVMRFPSGTQVGTVLIHASKTGQWTVRGSGVSYGGAYLEVHANALVRQSRNDLAPCTVAPQWQPGARSDLCER